ncbi:transposase family protein [Streptomyces sp. NPDC059828]|uniref:transposase family protein n=1 Tax=Streptomyces sp. NPDC059828 TaxID=3346965 RepID=UPI00364BDBB8
MATAELFPAGPPRAGPSPQERGAGAGGLRFGVSTATADRYVTETVDVLAERAPTLPGARAPATRASFVAP